MRTSHGFPDASTGHNAWAKRRRGSSSTADSAANGPCQQDLMWRLRGVSEECPRAAARMTAPARARAVPVTFPARRCPNGSSHLRNCRLLPVNKIAAVTGADREFDHPAAVRGRGRGQARGTARRMTRRADERRAARPGRRRMAQEHQVPVHAARAAVLARALGNRAAHRPVRRLGGPPGARPARRPRGSPWPGRPGRRFPAPQPLTAGLVSDLYEGCGLSLHHIELLTGRPAAAAGAVLRASGIKLRPPGGRSPFMERWRPGKA